MKARQVGGAIVEFIIIGPLVLFLGLVGIQYGLIYNAKLNVTYAAYEAARSGAIYNADPARITDAFYKGLVPFYSSTGIKLPGNIFIKSPMPRRPNTLQVAAAGFALKEEIRRSESAFVGVHMINPSKSSFDDWHDPRLEWVYQQRTGLNLNGRRIIPNTDLDIKDGTIGKISKETVQDANVLKLRITYGYEPRIPMMSKLFSSILSFMNSDRDALSLRILAAKRIPIVVDVSAQMLSPPIEAGLPMTTVNRTGFLANGDVANALVGGQAMRWQVGNQEVSAADSIGQSVTNDLQSGLRDANSLGSLVGQTLSNQVLSNSPTGSASVGTTNSVLGNTDNLLSCTVGDNMVNFF